MHAVNSSDRLVIVGASRTPIGRFLGSLAKTSAVELAMVAGRHAMTGIDPQKIDQVIVGNVLGAGLGMNIARQIGVKLGLPISTPAFSVNMMCASGMQAVILAAQAIRSGQASVVLAGGTESMSNAPYLLTSARSGYKFGDGKLVDSMLHDGLTDPFDQQHMALTAQRIADQYGLSREMQDAFALRSQERCAAAQKAGVFLDEMSAVRDVTADEHPRSDTTLAGLAKLKPAFTADGSITAGNASGINDGAAMLVVTTQAVADANGWHILASLDGMTAVGCDPATMGLGPIYAVRKLCEQTSSQVTDFDHVELNEAFAAQALACAKDLGLSADSDVLNPHGGAIAIGHPIGATGARLIVHLAHRIAQGKSQRALASLCVGGGMGVAVSLKA